MKTRLIPIMPTIVYHLGLTWLDSKRETHFSTLYVGNDKPIPHKELLGVGRLWLMDRIDKRAKRLLKTQLLETMTDFPLTVFNKA